MSDVVFAVKVELDVPGETGRQAKVFALWSLCLFVAVVVSAYRRPAIPERARETAEQQEILSEHRTERAAIALTLGLFLPGALTWWLTHHHRRGGGHARGITVDVTENGELRLWGGSYGQRIVLTGAEVTERLVDIYSGRLGAWRERRLSVRARKALRGSPSLLEIGARAEPSDELLGLALTGGEGDCVEVTRQDYVELLERIHSLAARAVAPPVAARTGDDGGAASTLA